MFIFSLPRGIPWGSFGFLGCCSAIECVLFGEVTNTCEALKYKVSWSILLCPAVVCFSPKKFPQHFRISSKVQDEDQKSRHDLMQSPRFGRTLPRTKFWGSAVSFLTVPVAPKPATFHVPCLKGRPVLQVVATDHCWPCIQRAANGDVFCLHLSIS